MQPATQTFRSERETILPPLEDEVTQPQWRSRDRFVEEAQLGVGGVGEVVRAMDLDIGRRVAIKRLRPDRRSSAHLSRFAREIRLVGALEHPNIVPLHDVGRTGSDEVYAVMKWVDGENLHELIGRLADGDPATHAAFPFERRVRLFIEVCRGIAFAHEQGVFHRDIKPANIMVGVNGEVQILDWGLAKGRRASSEPEDFIQDGDGWIDETQWGSVVGTPLYMSPEQAAGAPYTARSEVYALGLLLWELLTLQPPGDETSTTEQAIEYAKEREVPWAMSVPVNSAQGPVPAHLAWVIARAVKPNPEDRYPNVQALLCAMQKAMKGEFEVKCMYSFHQRMLASTSHWHDRHPLLFPFVTLGLVVTLFCAGVAFGLALG